MVLLLVVHSKYGLAQEQKGAITGTVTDQSGAILKGAQVSIEAQDVMWSQMNKAYSSLVTLLPGATR